MAKGHEHKIVTALETHQKAIPWKYEIEFSVVTGLKSVVEKHTRPDSQPNHISTPSY
jgi:hypothetical protein